MTPGSSETTPSPHLLFVNPWIHDFAAYDFWAKPLGLLMLAAVTRARGFRVSLVDCLDRFHPRSPEYIPDGKFGKGPYRKTHIPAPPQIDDIPRRYARYGIEPAWFRADLAAMERPDLIIVTSLMTYWYPGVFETIRLLKESFPGCPIVLGGIYATLCHEHATRYAGADLVLAGPGEHRIFDIIEAFTGYTTKDRSRVDHLDQSPYPALDLLSRIPYVPLMTTRGCPYRCAYCASRILHPGMARRQPGAVVAEIRHWLSFCDAADFVFYDDALLVDAESHAIPLMEKMIECGFSIRFHTPNALHIREITTRTARLMKDVGFETIRLGLETADFGHRDRLDRKVRFEEFATAVRALRAAGFRPDQVGAYLLAGLPGQPWSEVETSAKTVLEMGITPVLAYYSPIPHTPLWPSAVTASRYDLASDPIYTNNSILPCQPDRFSWETIAEVKQRLKQAAEKTVEKRD